MSDLPEILEAAIIRNPQPNDVLVLRVPETMTAEQMSELVVHAARGVGCKVVVIGDGIEVESFSGDTS